MSAVAELRADANIFIGHKGTLFRGPSRSFPREVWNRRGGCWEPYVGTVPKPDEWGSLLSLAEAWHLMANDQLGLDFGTPF
jgi:hypothetical protein